MKKLVSIIAIVVLVFSNAVSAFAAPTGTTQVTVTISKDLSVEVTGVIDFATLGVGATAVSGTAISVKNDGSGIDETVTLSVTDPAGWTQGAPGTEVYRISFQAAATAPAAGDANWKLEGAFSEALTYGQTKTVWVKLETPTATTVTTVQTIGVTFTAAE